MLVNDDKFKYKLENRTSDIRLNSKFKKEKKKTQTSSISLFLINVYQLILGLLLILIYSCD